MKNGEEYENVNSIYRCGKRFDRVKWDRVDAVLKSVGMEKWYGIFTAIVDGGKLEEATKIPNGVREGWTRI